MKTLPLRLWMLCQAIGALRWRPLTPSEIDEWYSPSELCLLNTSDFGLRPMLSLRNHCPDPKYRLCRVGMGHQTSLCMGPYSARKSFLYGFDEYVDAQMKPAHRLISALNSTNASIIIIGDSVGRQFFDFLHCEVRREGGRAMSTPSLLSGKYFLSSKMISRATDESVAMHFFPASEFYDQNIQNALWKLHNEHHKLLFAVNTGLHHHHELLYQSVVRAFLSDLERFYSSKDSRVVWLETTHQNFPNSFEQNGYFSAEDAARHKKELSTLSYNKSSDPDIFEKICLPIRNTSWRADWRNYIADLEVKRLNHPRVSFFTTNHSLMNVVDMFCVSSVAQLDCTHFCYSPLMWQPLYHHLAEVAESMC